MQDDRSGEPSGRVFAWAVRGVVIAIALLFISFAPFQHGSARVDLANGVIEHESRAWWGLTSSVSTRTTWVGEHHSAGEVDPVWRPLGRSNSGSWLSRGWVGSTRYKFVRFDEAELRDAELSGVITEAMRPTVADAVRRQWLRMADDGRDPTWDHDETLAGQLRYWEFEGRMLTVDDLLELEQGVPWDEVLYRD